MPEWTRFVRGSHSAEPVHGSALRPSVRVGRIQGCDPPKNGRYMPEWARLVRGSRAAEPVHGSALPRSVRVGRIQGCDPPKNGRHMPEWTRFVRDSHSIRRNPPMVPPYGRTIFNAVAFFQFCQNNLRGNSKNPTAVYLQNYFLIHSYLFHR